MIGLDDPRTEPDFDLDDPADQERLRAFAEACEARLLERTSAEWIAAFRAEDIPSGPVNWPPESFDDPQIAENRFYAELDHDVIGPHKTFGPIVQMDASPLRTHGSSPPLDRDTDRVLGALGYSEQEIAALRSEGVIGRGG